MPEIILPASASICAFAMAVITWYGALRNGVQLLYSDIQALKSSDRDVIKMTEDLHGQIRAIEDWKNKWFVWDDVPESMHLNFWGEEEHRGIKTTLNHMVLSCNLADKKLRKFTNIKEAKWNKMNRISKRVYFVGVKRDYIQKLVESIARDIAAIHNAAKAGWQRSAYTQKETIDSKNIYHAGVIQLLVPLAMRTRDVADALHLSCRTAQGNTTLELDLDIFDQSGSVFANISGTSPSSAAVSREVCVIGIAKAAKDGHLSWNVLGQNDLTGDMTSVRMQVKEATMPRSDCVVAPVALMRTMQGSSETSHFTSSGICSSVSMAQDSAHCRPEQRQTLRRLFSENTPPSFTNENFLGEVSKFRVAFEIAQACLLLLRSSWFPGICSCLIRCARSAPASAQFFGLRMGSIDHEAPRWGTTVLENCWGAAEDNWNVLTRPLRRSGFLLIEIVLGHPILQIQSDQNGAIRMVTFVEGDPPNLNRQSMTIEKVLRRVHSAFGDQNRKAQRAVQYCLSHIYPEAPTDDEMQSLLAEYYHKVVAPYVHTTHSLKA